MKVAILLFEDFETLDAFGPVEILGKLTEYISFYSQQGGLVSNSHGVSISTSSLDSIDYNPDIFIVPGGMGTRTEVNNETLIAKIKEISLRSKYVMTVCTGSALLAKTGLLDKKRATSNKRAFDWVVSTNDKVNWVKKARWVTDGKFYTSSGISAGMDMVFGYIEDLHGEELADEIAFRIEYNRQKDKNVDNFSR